MIIGIPRERKTLEKRVGMTPNGVKELTSRGHTVLLETNAGQGSGFGDDLYKRAGATIVKTLEEVWRGSQLLVKVKEPHESEYQYFREDLAIFDFLHLASLPELTRELLSSRVTSIAYELVSLPDMRLPILEPMSAIAGRLAVISGAYFLQSQHKGSGVLLGGLGSGSTGEVVVIGAGIAGRNACQLASRMGARVTVLDRSEERLALTNHLCAEMLNTVVSTQETLEQYIPKANLLIAAVLIPGAEPPKLVTRKLVSMMEPGSVIVDISIDQGGCVETIRPTSLDNPTYIEEGVIHYGVCNMPAQTPRTSTEELTKATLPYIIELADNGIQNSIKSSRAISAAVSTYKGGLSNLKTAQSLGLEFTSLNQLI